MELALTLLITVAVILVQSKASRKVRLFVWSTLLLAGALPTLLIIEFPTAGCCGSPDADGQGLGFVVSGLMVVVAIVLLVSAFRGSSKSARPKDWTK